MLLFTVLYGFWVANYVAFNGDDMRELAAQFLALAEKQGATVPLMIGHRIMGISLLCTGDIAEGRAHFDRAFALYKPLEHRPLATRFGQDIGVAILSWRAMSFVALGYPDAAVAGRRASARRGAGDRPCCHVDVCAATRMVDAYCSAAISEMRKQPSGRTCRLEDEKGAFFWKGVGMMFKAARPPCRRRREGAFR